MVELREIGDLRVGATPSRGASGPMHARYVRASDIAEDGTVRSTSDGPEPAKGRETQLSLGDIVIRSRGAPTAAIIGKMAVGAYPTNDLILFRPNREKAEARFIVETINLPTNREILSAGSQGAALSRLSIKRLGALQIDLPPLDEQHRITTLAEFMETEQHLLRRLRELRRQLNQQILQRLLGNAHDEGGNPRRGSHQSGHPKGGSVNPHLEVRNT